MTTKSAAAKADTTITTTTTESATTIAGVATGALPVVDIMDDVFVVDGHMDGHIDGVVEGKTESFAFEDVFLKERPSVSYTNHRCGSN